MRMNCRALCLLSLLVLAASVASADTQVQFFDPAGNLITNADVLVNVTTDGGAPVAKMALPPDADGTYDVPVEVGQRAAFQVFTGAATLANSRALVVKIAENPGTPLPIIVTPLGAANDLCTGAQAITLGVVTSDTTIGATFDAAPLCGTSNTAPGVWFSVVGNGTTLTASTCETVGVPPGSSAYDSKISVFCQDCAAPLCVGGNDDSPGCSFHSALSWCSENGATYLILVHGFSAAVGNFGLSVSSGATCTGAIACLPPPPTGACCLTSECPYEQGEVPVSCAEGVTVEDCTAAGGTYLGDDSGCIVAVNQVDIVSNPALAIPDNNPAGVNSVINVAASATISDLNVDIGINHTWISDLIVTVTGPSTTSQVIWNRVCGSTDNINATADDEGTETFCAPIAAGPIDSVFYPPALAGDGPLSVFDGENTLGNWTLNVSDNYAADLGTLNQWSIHAIEGAPACAPLDCPEPPCPEGSECCPGGCGSTEPPDDDEDGDSDEDNDHHWPWWPWHDYVEAEGASSGSAPTGLAERNNNSGSTEGSVKGQRGRLRE
jgi:subtilisin-like proprotein convertase family protein